MTFTKEVVISKKEFDHEAITKLVNEEIEKALPSSKYNVYSYVSVDMLSQCFEANVIVGLKFTFNHDQCLDYNFSSSFKLTDKMSEVYVRSVVSKLINELADSFKTCLKSDIESLTEYFNKL